jgi:hypothetical protein
MMDHQQYCLKWNHHQSNLLKVFSRLLGNEQFTDVLLATEGKTIRCHRVVLSACSSYFENLFMTFDEKNQIVILKDTTYDDVYALVEFMYRGEINVAQVSFSQLAASYTVQYSSILSPSRAKNSFDIPARKFSTDLQLKK